VSADRVLAVAGALFLRGADVGKAGTDVRLVRRLVLREPDVTVDAERRLLVGAQRYPAVSESIAEREAQRLERLFEEALEVRLARLEPVALVVGAQLEQESHRIGREPVEARHEPIVRRDRMRGQGTAQTRRSAPSRTGRG